MKVSLAARINITIIVIISLTTIGISSFFWYQKNNEIHRNLDKSMKEISSRLSSLLVEPMWTLNKEQVENLLRTEMENNNIVELSVHDNQLMYLIHLTRDENWKPVIKQDQKHDNKLLKHEISIMKNEGTIGKAEIFLTDKILKSKIRQELIHLIYPQLIVLIILIIIIPAVLNRNLTKPFRKIIMSFEALMYGDFEHQLTNKRTDEIGELTEHFIDTKHSLKSFIQEVEEQNRNLTHQIEDRKKAEKQTEIFLKFAEASSQGFGMSTLDGTVIYHNNALKEIVGMDVSESMIGKNLSEAYPDETKKRIPDIISDVLQNGDKSFETELLHNDTTRSVHQSLFIIQDDDQKPFCLATIVTDISTQIEYRKNLKDAKTKAEDANRLKSEFLANMSHELRTPMHGILSYATFGIEKHEHIGPDKIKEYFTNIRKSGDRLLSLLNSLLDLSKLESGRVEYQFRSHTFRRIVLSSIQNFLTLAANRNININYMKPTFNDTIECDKNKLTQVITNILSNSIKFSPNDSNIDINIKNEANAILVSIDDCGIGIPPAELEDIFDKFVQSSKSKSGAGGTGLGLSISKQIILDHNGIIWAENRTPAGTSFKIRLPKIIEQNTNKSATDESVT